MLSRSQTWMNPYRFSGRDPDTCQLDDHIKIHGLSFTLHLQESAWPTSSTSKGVLQPIRVSLVIGLDLSNVTLDSLSKSVDYSHLSNIVQGVCSDSSVTRTSAPTAYGLINEIADACASALTAKARHITVELELPKAVLLSETCGIRITRRYDSETFQENVFYIRLLAVTATIGNFPYEYERKQRLDFDLSFMIMNGTDRSLENVGYFDYGRIEQSVSKFVQDSSFLTLESLNEALVDECFKSIDNREWLLTVAVRKPAALALASAPEVVIRRLCSPMHRLQREANDPNRNSPESTVVALALGANVGDRFKNIELALRYLENIEPILEEIRSTLENSEGELRLVETSFLYETAPMYVFDQPSFINGACLLLTTFSGLDILRIAKAIENRIGRQKSERFGPRAVDVDVIAFGAKLIDTRPALNRNTLDNLEGELVVPHPRLEEREFVLRPLNDLIPHWRHPASGLSVQSMLRNIVSNKKPEDAPMLKVIPFGDALTMTRDGSPYDVPSTLKYWTLGNSAKQNPLNKRQGKATHLMATLNATPDSFSDGGEHLYISDALQYVEDAIVNGADIIDIGGYSTRPGAELVSTTEELARVVPIIQAIRASDDPSIKSVLISIDTFRWQVAEAAILAGANMINDVYAFSGPQYPSTPETETEYSDMKRIAHVMNVPVVMMHSRGDAGCNKDYSAFAAFGTSKGKFVEPVIQAIRMELGVKVSRVTEGAGCLRRWQVIVDPGLGFSKNESDNLAVLRHAHELVDGEQNDNPLAGYPLLIGASRKSFLGSIISRSGGEARPANDRDFATAATVACAAQQKVDIVRVHNVRGMSDTLKVSEAIWN